MGFLPDREIQIEEAGSSFGTYARVTELTVSRLTVSAAAVIHARGAEQTCAIRRQAKEVIDGARRVVPLEFPNAIRRHVAANRLTRAVSCTHSHREAGARGEEVVNAPPAENRIDNTIRRTAELLSATVGQCPQAADREVVANIEERGTAVRPAVIRVLPIGAFARSVR